MENKSCSLTSLVRAGGCGSKIGPSELRTALAGLPRQDNPRVLFGLGSGDDAGAFLVRDDLALIQTVDFFTPIVDDPYDFGAIAAANALSDCFALGADPCTVLNLMCVPRKMEIEIIKGILRGAADKVIEAGAVVLGGHTVDDAEPKFGLAVTGTQHPHRLIYNNAAKEGDLLIITKKIGAGIITNVAKQRYPGFERVMESVFSEVVESMKTLNMRAARLMHKNGVSAATDITGFGLLGHIRNLAEASRVSVEIDAQSVGLFDYVLEFAELAVGSGGIRNRAWVEPAVQYGEGLSESIRIALSDPQTSGPLLMTVAEDRAAGFLSELMSEGVKEARVIGRVVAKDSKNLSPHMLRINPT